MLNDIVKITQKVFNEFILDNKEVNTPKNIYTVYTKLAKVIDATQLVFEHYLALTFKEEYLQNSSFGKPSDKWRYFFNKDLEYLNIAAKEYLLALSYLSAKNNTFSCDGYISKIYNIKTYYGFVKDRYSVGFVEPCTFTLVSEILSTKTDQQSHYIEKSQKIDLTTYERRVQLQHELKEKYNKLLKLHLDLKVYILHNYTLKDIL